MKKLLYIQYCDAYAHAPQYVDRRIEKLDAIYDKMKHWGQCKNVSLNCRNMSNEGAKSQ